MEREYVKIYVEVRYNVFDEILNKISVDKKYNLDKFIRQCGEKFKMFYKFYI